MKTTAMFYPGNVKIKWLVTKLLHCQWEPYVHLYVWFSCLAAWQRTSHLDSLLAAVLHYTADEKLLWDNSRSTSSFCRTCMHTPECTVSAVPKIRHMIFMTYLLLLNLSCFISLTAGLLTIKIATLTRCIYLLSHSIWTIMLPSVMYSECDSSG